MCSGEYSELCLCLIRVLLSHSIEDRRLLTTSASRLRRGLQSFDLFISGEFASSLRLSHVTPSASGSPAARDEFLKALDDSESHLFIPS